MLFLSMTLVSRLPPYSRWTQRSAVTRYQLALVTAKKKQERSKSLSGACFLEIRRE